MLNFTNTPNKDYFKQIWIISVPIIVENILQTLLGTIDKYFAGGINDNAIAGIGVSEIIMNIYLSFFMALNIGISTTLSKSIGKKDVDKANYIIVQSIFLSMFIGLICGLISLLFSSNIISMTGASEDIEVFAKPYFLSIAIPSVFLSLSLTLSTCLRASKDSKTPMFFSVTSNILNIVLNIVFIENGFGILGLGLATTISRCFLAVSLLVVLFTRKSAINIKMSKINFNKKIILDIFNIGIFAGMDKLFMRIGQLIYTGMILSLGATSYIAHNIVGTLENYIYISTFALSTTIAILTGISIGENKNYKIDIYVKIANKINLFIILIFSLVFILVPTHLITLFTSTEEIIIIASGILKLLAISIPFISFTNIFTGALQGMGDTKFPMYTTLLGIWGIRLGLGYIFSQVLNYGINGVWFAILFDSIFRSLMLYFRYNQHFK